MGGRVWHGVVSGVVSSVGVSSVGVSSVGVFSVGVSGVGWCPVCCLVWGCPVGGEPGGRGILWGCLVGAGCTPSVPGLYLRSATYTSQSSPPAPLSHLRRTGAQMGFWGALSD